jgi:hypothetical protein
LEGNLLDPKNLRDYVIFPVCRRLALDTPAAVELLLGTAYKESKLKFLHQLGAGPALGLWQMEPATHNDIWENFLKYKPTLAQLVRGFFANNPEDATQLMGNLYYACAMVRVHYYRVKEPLPQAGDVAGMARYWKLYYNTPAGAGTEKEYRDDWAALRSYL